MGAQYFTEYRTSPLLGMGVNDFQNIGVQFIHWGWGHKTSQYIGGHVLDLGWVHKTFHKVGGQVLDWGWGHWTSQNLGETDKFSFMRAHILQLG